MIERIKLPISVNPGCASDCSTRWSELDNVLMGSPEGWPALASVEGGFPFLHRYHDFQGWYG